MDYILLFSLSLLIILLIIICILENKQLKNLKNTKIEEFTVDTISKCEKIKEEKEREVKDFQKIMDSKMKDLQNLLSEKEKRYNEVNQDLEVYRGGKIKEIDGAAAEYEKRKRLIVDKGIEEYRTIASEFFNEELWNQKEQINQVKEQKEDLLKDIETIKEILEEERSKRAAINEEILRQRKVEEDRDFYRIQLNEDDAQDIEILRSITSRLHHPEAINKVIWTGYYQKPLAELRKRAAIDDSGVYKITRLKTGEIYIGQAVHVSTRWADHCKSALGVGTLASSQLHRVMAQDGCENFLFEVLEEVPKDKLRERESYYIDFYDSKKYGLNVLRGDQNK